MFGTLAMTPPDDPVVTAITDTFTGKLPVALGVIGAGAVLAFGIKGAWIAWRAGSKAVGKAGS